MAQTNLIQFDGSLALSSSAIDSSQLNDVWSKLTRVRDEILKDDIGLFERGVIPEEKQPLDAGFIHLPDRLLGGYDENREASELGQILAAARGLADRVDRVVVLGIGGSYMGARALMDACTEPYHNERSRADRGGRPRIYFAGNNVDNDRTQGLLDLLRNSAHASSDSPENRWAIIVISKSGGTLETAVAFRQFYRALKESVPDESELANLIIPVTGRDGKLARLADEIGCRNRFEVPEGVGGRFSVLSPVGLLPAAVMGLDVVSLLRGAWMMNSCFEQAGQGDNPVLDYVAVNHLLEKIHNLDIRVLSVWNDSLESCGLWYDQLLSESIGKKQLGATPFTAVNTRDLHSRAQQHQQGKHNKIFNNVVVRSWRYDRAKVGSMPWNHDELDKFAELDLPDLMNAALAGTNEALGEDHRPTTMLTLPASDENSLGQFFQMFMLATVAEGRLLALNPYGQPGVEKYKQNMNKILNSKIDHRGSACQLS